MARKSNKKQTGLIAENRRARFNYNIEETFEAGIVLQGTEVKALRAGKANIAESYCDIENDEAFLINANIPVYEPASRFNHKPDRVRKLLLKRKEINKLMGAVQRKGRTIVPLKMFFNERGLVKLLIGIGIGKKLADKRQSVKDRDWKKKQARLMRERG